MIPATRPHGIDELLDQRKTGPLDDESAQASQRSQSRAITGLVDIGPAMGRHPPGRLGRRKIDSAASSPQDPGRSDSPLGANGKNAVDDTRNATGRQHGRNERHSRQMTDMTVVRIGKVDQVIDIDDYPVALGTQGIEHTAKFLVTLALHAQGNQENRGLGPLDLATQDELHAITRLVTRQVLAQSRPGRDASQIAGHTLLGRAVRTDSLVCHDHRVTDVRRHDAIGCGKPALLPFSPAMTQNALQALERERYISLETFRKNGTGVKTPVWFAYLPGDGDGEGSLVVLTGGKSHKIKRLQSNPAIKAAACNMNGKKILGPFHDGTCELVEDQATIQRAVDVLKRKYTWQWRIFMAAARLGGTHRDHVILRLRFGDAKP